METGSLARDTVGRIAFKEASCRYSFAHIIQTPESSPVSSPPRLYPSGLLCFDHGV
jgi:hypothetical protein